VSKWTEDNTTSFGIRALTGAFITLEAIVIASYKFSHFSYFCLSEFLARPPNIPISLVFNLFLAIQFTTLKAKLSFCRQKTVSAKHQVCIGNKRNTTIALHPFTIYQELF